MDTATMLKVGGSLDDGKAYKFYVCKPGTRANANDAKSPTVLESAPGWSTFLKTDAVMEK